MKPNNIILVRHGQSEGNINRSLYKNKPDFAINLTEQGREQANKLGLDLSLMLKNQSVFFYRSPFYRTRQTHEIISSYFPNSKFYEDPRLREQEWSGKLPETQREDLEDERDSYGHFYYRFDGGESCADVFDRVSDFLNTLYRDFEKPEFPENCIIVSHGMTNRLFLMRFLHYTVEEFEFLRNPENCGIYILEKQNNGKYKLNSEPKKIRKKKLYILNE